MHYDDFLTAEKMNTGSKSGRACRRQQQLCGGGVRAAGGGGAAGDRFAGVAAGAAVQAQRRARRHPRPVRRVGAQGPRLRDGRPGQSDAQFILFDK